MISIIVPIIKQFSVNEDTRGSLKVPLATTINQYYQ